MIQPLRTVHRNTFFCLVVLLPVLLGVGILKRHQLTESGSGGPTLPKGSVLTEQVVTFDGHKVAVDLYEASAKPVRVEFAESQPLVAPDVIVYWSEASPTAALPSDAEFLGVFVPGKQYAVPLGGRARGYLILYSVAHQALLGSFSYGGAQ